MKRYLPLSLFILATLALVGWGLLGQSSVKPAAGQAVGTSQATTVPPTDTQQAAPTDPPATTAAPATTAPTSAKPTAGKPPTKTPTLPPKTATAFAKTATSAAKTATAQAKSGNLTKGTPAPLAPPPPVVNGIDLIVSIQASPTTFTIGQTALFTVTVTNQGNAPTTAGSITAHVTLPAGLATAAVINVNGWNCPASQVDIKGLPLTNQQTFDCTFTGNLNANGNNPFQTQLPLTVNQIAGWAAVNCVPANGQLCTTLKVDIAQTAGEVDGTNNSATDQVVIAGFVDLTIAESHTPDPFVLNVNNQVFNLQVNNVGTTGTGANTVNVVGTISGGPVGGLTIATVAGSNWTCPLVAAATFACHNLAPIAAGGSAPFLTVTISANAPGTYTATFDVADATEEPSQKVDTQNEASVLVKVAAQPIVNITKTTTTTTAIINEPIDWTLTVTNTGAGAGDTTGVTTVTDDVAAVQPGLVIGTITPPVPWICTGQGGTVLSCTDSATITAGSTILIPFTTTVTNVAYPNGISNGASVSTVIGPNNQTAKGSFGPQLFFPTVVNIDASITTKTHTGTACNSATTPCFVVDASGTAVQTWVVTIHNAGTTAIPASTIVYTDTLPGGVVVLAAPTGAGGATWNCAATVVGSANISCTNTSALAIGADTTITTKLKVLPAAFTGNGAHTVTNSGEKVVATFDNVPGNDTGPNDVVTVLGADLTVSKTASPGIFTATQQASYLITVTNSGTGPTTSQTSITDTLPANVAFANANPGSGTTWVCPAVNPLTDNKITCTYNPVINPNGGTSSVLTILVIPAQPETAVNTVVVSNPDEVDTTNDTFTLNTTVNSAPRPDLNLTKDTNNVTLQQNVPGHFFLRLTNVGTAPTTSIAKTTITDTIPAGFTIGTPAETSALGFACGKVGQLVTCTFTGIIPTGNAVYTIDIPVTPTAAGAWTNTAQVSTDSQPGDNDPGNDTAFASGTVSAPDAPDLLMSVTHSVGFVVNIANQFNVSITNVGTIATTAVPATTNISVDARFTITSVTPADITTTCQPPAGNLVTCTTTRGGVALNGNFATVTVAVTPKSTGAFCTSAVVTPANAAGQSNTANDQSSDCGTITSSAQPDLTVSKTHQGTFTVGLQGDFSISVSNIGSAATNGSTITVTDTLPNGLTYIGWSGAGWTCPDPTVPAQTTVICTLTPGTILGISQTSSPLTISVRPTAGGNLTNKVHVSTTQAESSTANNDASDIVFVNGAFDLTISKSHSPAILQADAAINTQSYLITVSNIGTIPTPNGSVITVTDQLDPALGAVSASGPAFACAIDINRLLKCTSSNPMLPNTPTSITVLVNPLSLGATFPEIFTNVANVTITNATENNTGNNSASDPTTINNGPLPDLSLTMTHTGGFLLNGTGNWLLTVKNVGTANFVGTMTVTDTLPGTPISFVSASGGWNCPAANPLVCTNSGGLGAQGTSTINILVSVGPSGTQGQQVTNSAILAHVAGDPTTGDESASDTVTLGVTPPISPTLSKITALTTQLVNNGNITFHEITVSVKDTTNQPMQGVLIALTPSTTLSGFLVVNPSAGYSTLTTDTNGNVFFDLSSTQAGSVTFSATANSIAISNTVTVNFSSSTGINTGNSSCTVGTSSLAQGSSNTTSVSVTLRDNSNNFVNGASVLLNKSVSGTDTSTISGSNPTTTSGNGAASWTVAAGTTNETITFSINVNSGQATLNCNQTLTIGSGGGGTTTGLSGTVTSDTVSLPDDNLHFATITVNLKNNGTGYSGRHIVLNPSPTMAGFSSQPAPNAVTDTNGNTSFTVRSTSQGAVTLTAVDSDDNFTIGSVTVTFTAVGTVQVYSTTGVTSTTGAPTGPTGPTQGYVITRLLCIRQGPGFGYKRFPTGLRFRTVVTVLGRASRVIFPAVRDGCIHKGGPTWFYIQLADGSKMWANATYIRVPLAGFRGLPVLPAPPLPAAPGA